MPCIETSKIMKISWKGENKNDIWQIWTTLYFVCLKYMNIKKKKKKKKKDFFIITLEISLSIH